MRFWLGCLVFIFSFIIGPADIFALVPSSIQLDFVRRQQRLLNVQEYDSNFGCLPKLYRPRSGETFEILNFWVPLEAVHVFDSQSLPAELRDFFIKKKGRKEFIRFLVHPWSLDFYRDFLRTAEPTTEILFGTPTASSRTILIWSETLNFPPFFGKLSLAAEVSGTFRCLTGEEIARSLGTMHVLERLKKKLPKRFHYFPEVLGVMPKNMERGGFILRIFPQDLSDKQLQSFFLTSNLFVSNPELNGRTYSEMGSVFSHSKQSLEAEVLRVSSEYLSPFITQWVDLLLLGFATNPHGQNLYMRLNPKKNYRPAKEYLYQDFGDFNLDLKFIEKAFKVDTNSLPQIYGLEKDYRQSEIANEIQTSITEYFKAGTLVQLAEQLNRQADRFFAESFFYRFMSSEILRELKGRLNYNFKEVDLKRNFNWLSDLAAIAKDLRLRQGHSNRCVRRMIGIAKRVQYYRLGE